MSWQERLVSKRLWVLIGITFTGFWLRVWGLDFGLPNDSVPSESDILGVILTNLLTPVVLAGDVSFHPHEFTHPGLYYYVLSVIYGLLYMVGRMQGLFGEWQSFLMLWQENPSLFHLVLRGFSVVCGTMMIPVAYLLGKRVLNRLAGLVFASLLAGSYLLVRTAHLGTPDTPSALMGMLALLMLVRFHQKRKEQSLWEACAVAGLAAGFGYLSLCLLSAIGMSQMMPFWRSDKIDWPGFIRVVWKSAGLVLGVFLLCSPWVLLDFPHFWQNAQQSLMGRHMLQTDWTGWRFYPTYALFYGLGGWVLALAGMGIYRAVRHTDASERWLHWTLLSFLILSGIVLGMSTRPLTADILLITPVFLLYAAIGTLYLGELLHVVVRGRGRRQTLPIAIVMLIALYQPLSLSLKFNKVIAEPDTRNIARQIMLQHISPGASVATGPRTGRLHLPMAYGQLLDETGQSGSDAEEVQLARISSNIHVASSFTHPQMFRDLGIQYVVLFDGLPPFSNTAAEWQALTREATPVFNVSPQKRGVFQDQINLNNPWFEPFSPIYLPFKGLEHFERPGPIIGVFDVGQAESGR